MKAHQTWTVLQHDPIAELAENLWCVQGAVPGMSLRRNMTLARFADGSVLVHSPIALDEPSMRRIESFGDLRYLAVPNGGHRLDSKIWKARYPKLEVLAPRGARSAVAEVVPVDRAYDELRQDDSTVQLVTLDGVQEKEGALLVRSADGTTVVLNDSVMNMDPRKDVVGWLVTTALGSSPGPRVSRLAKLLYIKDQSALKADLERFCAIPDLVRVIVSHDKIAHGPEAVGMLRQAMTYL